MGGSTLYWYSTTYTGRIIQKGKNKGQQEKDINRTFPVRRLHDKLLKTYYDVEESETLSRPSATVTQWLSMMDGLRKYKMSKPGGYCNKGKMLVCTDMGNTRVKVMDPSLWEVIKKEYAKLAELSHIMYERVVYLTAGRTLLWQWTSMSTSWANDRMMGLGFLIM
jgi:hypothetical protein